MVSTAKDPIWATHLYNKISTIFLISVYFIETESKIKMQNTAESTDTLKIFSKQMLSEKVFNCSLCEKLLIAPIMLVEDVGNICHPCFSKDKPEQEAKSGLRNVQLERVLQEVIVPCQFQEKGCSKEMPYKLLQEHQEACRFRNMKCLLLNSNCDWTGFPKDFASHFITHKDNVIQAENNLYFFTLNFRETGEIIKMLKSQCKHCFIKITITEDSVYYNVCDSRNDFFNFKYKYTIKHIGSSNNAVDIECKLLALSKINHKDSATKTDIPTLREVIGTSDTIFLVIKPDISEMNDELLRLFECPVCNLIMKPPIYVCKTGHSFCHKCQPKLKQCPTCRSELGVSCRNYSLEALTGGIFYNCCYTAQGCDQILCGNDIGSHETFCTFKPNSSSLLTNTTQSVPTLQVINPTGFSFPSQNGGMFSVRSAQAHSNGRRVLQ